MSKKHLCIALGKDARNTIYLTNVRRVMPETTVESYATWVWNEEKLVADKIFEYAVDCVH